MTFKIHSYSEFMEQSYKCSGCDNTRLVHQCICKLRSKTEELCQIILLPCKYYPITEKKHTFTYDRIPPGEQCKRENAKNYVVVKPLCRGFLTNACNKMFLNFPRYCYLVMLTDLNPARVNIKRKTLCRGTGRQGEERWIYLLTVDGQFHSLAVPTLADRVAGHTAVSPLVLFPHRTDE